MSVIGSLKDFQCAHHWDGNAMVSAYGYEQSTFLEHARRAASSAMS